MTKKTTKNKPLPATEKPAPEKPGDQEQQRPQTGPTRPADNAGEEPEDDASATSRVQDVPLKKIPADEAIAAPAPTTAEKLAAMRAKKEELELEDLTYKLENERNRRSERQQQVETQQRSIEDANRQRKLIQAACPHRKGGKDMGGLTRGTDTKFAVGTVTTPWGQQYVLCSRCGMTVWGPFNGKPADPGFYEAIQWPTDNEPSGTQIFLVYPPKSPDVAASTGELVAK